MDRDNASDKVKLVPVDYTLISEQALRGIIESFVLREGTDYGDGIYSLDSKVKQVQQQLERREAEILFDPVEETCDIRVRRRLESVK